MSVDDIDPQGRPWDDSDLWELVSSGLTESHGTVQRLRGAIRDQVADALGECRGTVQECLDDLRAQAGQQLGEVRSDLDSLRGDVALQIADGLERVRVGDPEIPPRPTPTTASGPPRRGPEGSGVCERIGDLGGYWGFRYTPLGGPPPGAPVVYSPGYYQYRCDQPPSRCVIVQSWEEDVIGGRCYLDGEQCIDWGETSYYTVDECVAYMAPICEDPEPPETLCVFCPPAGSGRTPQIDNCDNSDRYPGWTRLGPYATLAEAQSHLRDCPGGGGVIQPPGILIPTDPDEPPPPPCPPCPPPEPPDPWHLWCPPCVEDDPILLEPDEGPPTRKWIDGGVYSTRADGETALKAVQDCCLKRRPRGGVGSDEYSFWVEPSSEEGGEPVEGEEEEEPADPVQQYADWVGEDLHMLIPLKAPIKDLSDSLIQAWDDITISEGGE